MFAFVDRIWSVVAATNPVEIKPQSLRLLAPAVSQVRYRAEPHNVPDPTAFNRSTANPEQKSETPQ